MLLAKTKQNPIEVLISKAVIDSYINHDKFVSVNNVLRFNIMRWKLNQKSWKCCGIYYTETI